MLHLPSSIVKKQSASIKWDNGYVSESGLLQLDGK